MEKWLNWAGKLADLEKKNEFELAEITQKTLCKHVGAFGFVVLHQVISKGIWYFLPQSISVATINWESIPIKATIAIPSITKAKTVAVESTVSQPGIGLRLSPSISGPLAISISTVSPSTVSKPWLSLSISGPLAISVAKSTISITSIPKAKTMAVESTISQPGIGLGLSLSISGPLAISVSESTIAITSITKAKSVAVESTISQPGISLGLGLSISGPLSVAVSKAITTPDWEAVAIEAAISIPGLGLCLGLSFGVGTCHQAKNCNKCLHIACRSELE